MSTICRTCLQKSKKTFKTNQNIPDFGGGEVKISIVLRFCMPELYLGLSSNPEICYDCAESLKVSYVFKKKCLNTENIIGNFLKNARCTARSVDLHDVLAYFNEQSQLQSEMDKAKQRLCFNTNAQEILSEWDDVSEEPGNSEKIIPEVPQKTPDLPTPQSEGDNTNKMTFCHQTGLFFDQLGQYYDCSGYPVDINQIRRDKVINDKETTVDEAQVVNDRPDFIQDTEENFCKITSVFSLTAETDNESVAGGHDSITVDDASNLKDASNTNENVVDIKEEPMDVGTNGECVDLHCYPSDEDTLDASETASYEERECTSRLQGIIDSIPEISDTNQYVDVPEFVHINNFGLKELEELRRQQQSDGQTGENKIILNFKNKLASSLGTPRPGTSEKDTTVEDGKERPKMDEFTKVPLSTLPETLVINGKKMVKCSEGYRLMEDPESKPVQILSRVRKLVNNVTSGTQTKVDPDPVKPPGRKRRKIKIVPVNDTKKYKLCSQKGAKLDLKVGKPAKTNRVRLLPATNDKDVVVLFTNYTYGGDYVNDHDYLVNPYKRNKVLIEEKNQWYCMCYICHTRHEVLDHVPHMQKHTSKCKVCRVDLGTPYMLNVHVRSHCKPCRQCTERVPYGKLDSHDQEHLKDEIAFEMGKKRGRGRRKRTMSTPPVKQVPQPVEKTEPDLVEEEIKPKVEMDTIPFVDEVTEEESSDDEEWKKNGSTSKKPRKRRRKHIKTELGSVKVERSSRVLRSNVKKSYSETECEDAGASDLNNVTGS